MAESKPKDLWQSLQSSQSYHLKRVAYVSQATHPFTDKDFEDIEEKSIISNNEHDITGILFFHEKKILQILEGSPESVDSLISKIAQDSRHTDFKVFSSASIDERLLTKWSMVMRGAGATPKELLETFLVRYDFFRSSDEHVDITPNDINMLKEIILFSALPSFT